MENFLIQLADGTITLIHAQSEQIARERITLSTPVPIAMVIRLVVRYGMIYPATDESEANHGDTMRLYERVSM